MDLDSHLYPEFRLSIYKVATSIVTQSMAASVIERLQ